MFANPVTSTLNNLEVAEYVADGAGLERSYGSTAVSYTHLTLPTILLV